MEIAEAHSPTPEIAPEVASRSIEIWSTHESYPTLRVERAAVPPKSDAKLSTSERAGESARGR
jgi:hypothetical protein